MGEIKPTKPMLIEDRTRLIEVIRVCEVSRTNRRQYADILRTWYEQGTSGTGRARYNKLFAHLNRVAAFLFAPGAVRFGVHLPPAVREAWLSAAAAARDEFRQTWTDADADTVAVLMLEWALVYGGTGCKIQADPNTGFRPGYIQPWDLGVGREDVPDLEEQDTLCHWYTLSVPQIERWVHGEPDEDAIVDLAKSLARPLSRLKSMRNRLVISSVTGTFPNSTVTGGFPGEPQTDATPTAQVDEPTVEFVDVWERRMFRRKSKAFTVTEEVFEDWLVTTLIAEKNEPLAQRRNPDLPWTRKSLTMVLPAELPFIVLTPRPLPDYFWGRSELEGLTELQEWLDDHISKMKGIVDRQMDPPRFYSGIPDFEEAGRAMSTAGGSYGSPEPGSKMEALTPQLTAETVKMTDMIQGFFSDVSGIPGSVSEPGQMGGGIRSTGHFSMAAGIGAGRLRQMALVVEQTLGVLATKAFHLLQRQNTELHKRPDGPPFLLSQIPSNIRLKVDAHSAAPIFAEQTQQKATLLQRAGALSGEDYVELMDMPNSDELKANARKLAESKAELVHEKMAIEKEKAERKGAKAPLK